MCRGAAHDGRHGSDGWVGRGEEPLGPVVDVFGRQAGHRPPRAAPDLLRAQVLVGKLMEVRAVQLDDVPGVLPAEVRQVAGDVGIDPREQHASGREQLDAMCFGVRAGPRDRQPRVASGEIRESP